MIAKKNASAYHELVDLLARSAPEKILSFRLSPKAAKRIETLIAREKNKRLKPAELEELDTYMHLNRIVMLAQAQAYKILHGASSSKNS